MIITVGDNVRITKVALLTSSVFEEPTLSIGNRTGIGYSVEISVGKKVTIGNDCMISNFSVISDNNGHYTAPEKRHQRLSKDEFKEVTIGNNVWIGPSVFILRGSTIGDNSVVAAGTVIPGLNIPPNTLAYGNPVKFKLLIPELTSLD